MGRGFDTASSVIDLWDKIEGEKSFVCRYVSDQTSWKTLTPEEIKFLREKDIALIPIIERNPTHPGYFQPGVGRYDVARLKGGLEKLGLSEEWMTGVKCAFTVDYDAGPETISDIRRYFREIHDAKAPFGTIVYGNGYVCEEIQKAFPNMGKWLSCSKGWRGYPDANGLKSYSLVQELVNDSYDLDISDGHAGGKVP